MPLLIREQEVDHLLPMRQALMLVEDALRAHGQGRAENQPRERVRAQSGVLQIMPAALHDSNMMGFKAYTAVEGKTQFYFHLFDGMTGEYLAIIEADRLGQLRTGAASGVATKHLAREDAMTAGIVGTGWQAESQLEAICMVRRLRTVRCYAREEKHRTAFAEKMTARLGVRVEPVDDVRHAVFDSDIVVTATTSSTPVLLGNWLTPGAHINAMGANWPQKRELDDRAIQRCDAIFVDSLEQVRLEAGDLLVPAKNGKLSWDIVQELGAVVAGKVIGRKNPEEITLFKSTGIALEDVAVGSWVYAQAREHKLGQMFDL